MHRTPRRSLSLLSLFSLTLSLFLFLSLLFTAAGAFAAPVMTFVATFATTGIDDTQEQIFSNSAFHETGIRSNFIYTLRDEVVVDNGLQTTYHYRDVTYDVAGHWRDSVSINLAVSVTGAHTAQFGVIGSLAPLQIPRLIDGNLDFQAGVNLSGGYLVEEVPEYPDLQQPPPPPLFADLSSGATIQLPVSTTYDPATGFAASAEQAFTATRGRPFYEYSWLLYGNEDLLTERIDFVLYGPGYDAAVRNQGYTELLGTDVVAVPEPRVWAMLLVGVGVLTLSRRSGSRVFRKV